MLSRLTKRINQTRYKRHHVLKSNFSTKTQRKNVSEINMSEALKIPPEELKTLQSTIKPQDSESRDKVFSEKKMTAKDHLKVILHHMKKGFIGVYKDTSYLVTLLKKKQLREEIYTIYELRERRRMTKDLIKFLPYSIFMTVPFLEFALPFYMLLFPNSTPTHFLFDNQIGEKTKELVEQQRDSYRKIIPLLPKFANVIGLDPIKFVQSIEEIIGREGKEKDRMYYKMGDFESKLDSFVKKYEILKRSGCLRGIGFESMTAYELEQTSKLLCLDYIPGYNLVNKLIWTFTRLPFASYKFVYKKLTSYNGNFDFENSDFYKFQFYFNKGPLKILKKRLLITQIRYHMEHIKSQDRQLSKDLVQLEELSASDLSSIARQRGIKLEKSEDIKEFMVKYWLPLSVDYNLDVDVLVWVSFMRYSYVDVLV